MWKMDKLGCEEFGIQIHITLSHKDNKRFSVCKNKYNQFFGPSAPTPPPILLSKTY